LPFEGQLSAAAVAGAVASDSAKATSDKGAGVEKVVSTVKLETGLQENLVKKNVEEVKPNQVEVKAYVKPVEVVERKKFTAPSGTLITSNLGIKTILDPPKNKQAENQDALLPDLAQSFGIDRLKQVWAEYAQQIKAQKKDNLYTTLTNSVLTMTPDYKIQLEISNSAAVFELEREKSGLLGFLRSNLKNYQLTFNHKVSVNESASPLNSRATFEKLSEENPALLKLQKLFGLDIDY